MGFQLLLESLKIIGRDMKLRWEQLPHDPLPRYSGRVSVVERREVSWLDRGITVLVIRALLMLLGRVLLEFSMLVDKRASGYRV